jgi:hypothetical protein
MIRTSFLATRAGRPRRRRASRTAPPKATAATRPMASRPIGTPLSEAPAPAAAGPRGVAVPVSEASTGRRPATGAEAADVGRADARPARVASRTSSRRRTWAARATPRLFVPSVARRSTDRVRGCTWARTGTSSRDPCGPRAVAARAATARTAAGSVCALGGGGTVTGVGGGGTGPPSEAGGGTGPGSAAGRNSWGSR